MCCPSQDSCFSRISVCLCEQVCNIYCWVHGHVSKKITWRKLGGNLHRGINAENSVLHISNAQRSHTGSYLYTAFTSYGIFREVIILGIKSEIF